MSLTWKTATSNSTPWAHEDDDEDLHDGVEEYGGFGVAHPDDTPYHDEDLMGTARVTREPFDPHAGDFEGMQAWLSKPTLDHFVAHPESMDSPHDPIKVLHDEDTGEKYLLNGHHRVVVARHLGTPALFHNAEFHHVSRSRM